MDKPSLKKSSWASYGKELDEYCEHLERKLGEKNRTIRVMRKSHSELERQRKSAAIDGQCALDEANNRIVELENSLRQEKSFVQAFMKRIEDLEQKVLDLQKTNGELGLQAVGIDPAKPGSDKTVLSEFDNGEILSERVIPPQAEPMGAPLPEDNPLHQASEALLKFIKNGEFDDLMENKPTCPTCNDKIFFICPECNSELKHGFRDGKHIAYCYDGCQNYIIEMPEQLNEDGSEIVNICPDCQPVCQTCDGKKYTERKDLPALIVKAIFQLGCYATTDEIYNHLSGKFTKVKIRNCLDEHSENSISSNNLLQKTHRTDPHNSMFYIPQYTYLASGFEYWRKPCPNCGKDGE